MPVDYSVYTLGYAPLNSHDSHGYNRLSRDL